MKGHVVRTCVVVTALILAAGAWAQAQAPSMRIGFGFLVGGKLLDAGNYTVDISSNGNVVLTPETGGNAVEVPPVKTLSQRNVNKPELIFERVGSVRFLSEVWLPGKGGFLVVRRADAQEREFVTGSRDRK